MSGRLPRTPKSVKPQHESARLFRRREVVLFQSVQVLMDEQFNGEYRCTLECGHSTLVKLPPNRKPPVSLICRECFAR